MKSVLRTVNQWSSNLEYDAGSFVLSCTMYDYFLGGIKINSKGRY